MFNTKRLGARGTVAGYAFVEPSIGQVTGPDQIVARSKAVVIDRLSDPVAVYVEHGAYMRQAIPLRGILKMEYCQVIGQHIGPAWVELAQQAVHIHFSAP